MGLAMKLGNLVGAASSRDWWNLQDVDLCRGRVSGVGEFPGVGEIFLCERDLVWERL